MITSVRYEADAMYNLLPRPPIASLAFFSFTPRISYPRASCDIDASRLHGYHERSAQTNHVIAAAWRKAKTPSAGTRPAYIHP